MQAAGLGWLAAVAEPRVGYGTLVAPLIIAGVGVSMCFPTVANAVTSSVPPADVGVAAGTNNALNALGGVFGALRDASPDYWGRRVIQRHLGKAQPSEMEYLLFSPDDRAGALGFGLNRAPPAPKRTFNQTLELAN